MVSRIAESTERKLDQASPISADFLEHPSIGYLARYGLNPHYSVASRDRGPGFFIGDGNNLDDLVACWNLRATDISVLFVDRDNPGRYSDLIPAWKKVASDMVAARRFEVERRISIWSREDNVDVNERIRQHREIVGEGGLLHCGISEVSWNGLNLQAPMVILGETAQLGVLASEREVPRLSFALADKPFCGDTWFHTQRLVASLSFIGTYGDDLHTLVPPYIPELNEFYARSMIYSYDDLRSEPGRVGIVIDAADTDASICALRVSDLFDKIFRLAGFTARPSSGGLIARQLVTQLGGLRGAAVFRIPGVRRLLKTFGPADAFTGHDAINKIGSRDPENPNANFSAFEDLYIEPRKHGTKLQATDVFAYLVEKGLFRIGSVLACPHCRMSSWVSIDTLRERVTCEMCGDQFNASRQLVGSRSHYRRSGLLGAERNAQGAIPVLLVLHQLQTNLGHGFRDSLYSTSLELFPEEGTELPKCEIDFVWLQMEHYPRRITIILGESKDRGQVRGGGGTIDATDIENLEAIANALPSKRFEPFIMLAKLCTFTEEEVAAAGRLNDRYRQRAILLTDRELEPWHLYDRTRQEFDIDQYASSAAELARNTARIYFIPDS